MVVHICNHSSQEMESGGSEVQAHSGLHSHTEINMGYVRSCLKKKVLGIQQACLTFDPCLSIFTILEIKNFFRMKEYYVNNLF